MRRGRPDASTGVTDANVRISLDAVDLCERSMAEVRAAQGPGAADYVRLDLDRLRALNDARQARADAERARAALAYLIGMEPLVSDLHATNPWPALAERAPEPSLNVILSRVTTLPPHWPGSRAGPGTHPRAARARPSGRRADAALPFVDGTSVGVAFPLFTRNYFQGALQRAEARVQAAALHVQRTRGLVASELARARAELTRRSIVPGATTTYHCTRRSVRRLRRSRPTAAARPA